MAKNPLSEVFGFPVENHSDAAKRHRKNKLCPFNNVVPNCTKDKSKDPLGVCSINHDSKKVITCPIRFQQDWLIVDDAASFFFKEGANWTSLKEVKLKDKNGKSAGNIDIVLVAYDDREQIIDFGTLEVQAVYISGNVRQPFVHFMSNPENWKHVDWRSEGGWYPKPDFLSSSRKRLIPQMLYKGGIMKAWDKKQAVAIQNCFYETLPDLPEVEKEQAEVAWFLYDLKPENDRLKLVQDRIIYTKYSNALNRITTPEPGDIENFLSLLQEKLDDQLENPPDAPTLFDIPLQ